MDTDKAKFTLPDGSILDVRNINVKVFTYPFMQNN